MEDIQTKKLHNFWSHACILKRIKELGAELDIKVELTSEAYTSKTCCMCGRQHNGRTHRGLHVFRQVHRSQNADVNGAYNVYSMYMLYINKNDNVTVNRTLLAGREIGGNRALASPLMQRWELHRWHQDPLSTL